MIISVITASLIDTSQAAKKRATDSLHDEKNCMLVTDVTLRSEVNQSNR